MDFALTQEQQLLKTTARDFLTEHCPPSHVREMERDAVGFSRPLWTRMAQLGWLGLTYPESAGGAELTFLELAVLLEEMGRALLPGPFLGSVLCGSALLDSPNDHLTEQFLPALASGELIVLPALYENRLRPDVQPRSTCVVPADDGYCLEGEKYLVEYGHAADWLLVPARRPDDAIVLLLVQRTAAGVGTTPERTIDRGKYSHVSFAGVRVAPEHVVAEGDAACDVLGRLMVRGAAAMSVWMVGGAARVLETTVEYALQRQQFGRPIGSFQAIQHKCASMQVESDAARFLAFQAAWRLAEGLPSEREVSMAKARASEAYRRICLESHQVHGAIGFTWEYDLQLYTRRAKAAELLFGDAQWHRERVAEFLQMRPPAA
jgi:alkylation response protein AidB-like acyl-CoA dehydrogenase